MKLALALMLLVSPAFAADGFVAPEGFSEDFKSAHECADIDGRKVWEGREAYYMQANAFTTSQSGLLDDEAVSAVPRSDNNSDSLAPFKAACE